MKIVRLMSAASAAGAIGLILAGSAAADSANVGLTGPDSNQSINVVNKTTMLSSNTNKVTTVNVNVQFGNSGNVAANNNTTAGGLASGGVVNQSKATNSVVINNSGSAPAAVTGGQGGLVAPSASQIPGSSQISAPSGGRGAVALSGGKGSVLGASTAPTGGMGAAILPVTGPLVPVDVSALRAAWHPSISAANPATVKGEQAFSTGMLIVASVLSLIGAVLTGLRGRRTAGRA